MIINSCIQQKIFRAKYRLYLLPSYTDLIADYISTLVALAKSIQDSISYF